MNIEELKKEIEMQSRNGRNKIYIKKNDLRDLGMLVSGEYGSERMYIELSEIEDLIKSYEKNPFKASLRVPVSGEMKLDKVDNAGYYFKDIER